MGRSVLWINQFAAGPAMTGGTRHVELGRELVRLGWSVRILASDLNVQTRRFERRASADDRSAISDRFDGVDVQWLWSAPYETNDHRRVLNWLSFSRSVLTQPLDEVPDVIIGSSPHLFAAAAGLLLAIRLRRPFVLEVRDLWPESLALTGRRPGLGYAGMWVLARSLYAAASRIIVLAQGVRDYLVERGAPADRFVFVPNGVDTRAFGMQSPPARERLRLVYAGAHGPANGLDAVLDAAQRLRDMTGVEFLLVGDGPSKPELVARAAEMNLTNLRFIPAVPKSEMPALLADCDGGLMILKDLPLFSFGVSPNKLFDYWGATLPVVCNVAGEVAGLVREAGGGVQAASGSGESLAAAVRQLAAIPPTQRREMGERGRAWVVRERDRRVVAASLDRALSQLIGGAAPSPSAVAVAALHHSLNPPPR